MKTTDSSDRLKALMRQHTANSVAALPAPATITTTRPPTVAAVITEGQPMRTETTPQNHNISWNRITIRITAGEFEKINNVVIATQQANRTGKVTATDVLRAGLRRIKEQEAISATEIKVLRARDTRFAKTGNV